MSTKTNPRRRSAQELRAIAFHLADLIETEAQAFIRAGHTRDWAIALASAKLAGI